MKEMDAGTMDPSGRGQTQAGKICGIIGTILMILSVLGGILFVMMVGMGAAAGRH